MSINRVPVIIIYYLILSFVILVLYADAIQ